MRRLAVVLQEHAEEGRYPHSRIFDTLIPKAWIVEGTSTNGGGWEEHVVPCSYLAAACVQKFRESGTVDEVMKLLEQYLKIVHISKEEQNYLDIELKLRTCMPAGWKFGTGNAFARLEAANILIAAPTVAT